MFFRMFVFLFIFVVLSCSYPVYAQQDIFSIAEVEFDRVLESRKKIDSACQEAAAATEKRIKTGEDLAAGRLTNITADTVQYGANKAIAVGNVTILYRDAVIKADKIVYDEADRTITAEGNVDIVQKTSQMKADYAVFDLDTEQSELTNASGSTDEIEQEGRRIQGRVYFWGEKVIKGENTTRIKNGIFTTCDCPKPELHYHISCKDAEIFPGKKIVAYNSKLKLKKKTLLNYRKFVISLKKNQQELIPKIGTNSDDGWYIKKGFNFDLFGTSGKANIDLYQKTGIGFGVKYPYSFDNGKLNGYLDFYNLSPSSNALITESLTDEQKVRTIGKKELRNNVRYELGKGYYVGADIGSYDYQYPDTPSSSWNNCNVYFGRNTKNQVYYFSQNTTDYNTSTYQTRTFNFAQRIGQGWTVKLGGYYSGYAGNIESNDSVWRYYTDVNYSNNFMDSTLTYLRSTNNELFHVDKVPELSFMTKNMYIGDIPIKAAVSAGSYREEPTGLNLSKSKMYLGIEPVSIDVGSYGTLDIAGGLQQTLCDDGSGQYVISGESGYKHKISDWANLRVNYFYQEPNGYSPFVDDYTPSYSMLTAGVEVFNDDFWKLTVSGGYDYTYDLKTSLISTLEMKPSDKLHWTLGSYYNVNDHYFPTFTSQLRVDLGDGLSFENWSLYDNVNDKFTYMNIGITKESHDFVTKLIYRNQQKDVWLQFYLKAFPEQPVYINPDVQRVISPSR